MKIGCMFLTIVIFFYFMLWAMTFTQKLGSNAESFRNFENRRSKSELLSKMISEKIKIKEPRSASPKKESNDRLEENFSSMTEPEECNAQYPGMCYCLPEDKMGDSTAQCYVKFKNVESQCNDGGFQNPGPARVSNWKGKSYIRDIVKQGGSESWPPCNSGVVGGIEEGKAMFKVSIPGQGNELCSPYQGNGSMDSDEYMQKCNEQASAKCGGGESCQNIKTETIDSMERSTIEDGSFLPGGCLEDDSGNVESPESDGRELRASGGRRQTFCRNNDNIPNSQFNMMMKDGASMYAGTNWHFSKDTVLKRYGTGMVDNYQTAALEKCADSDKCGGVTVYEGGNSGSGDGKNPPIGEGYSLSPNARFYKFFNESFVGFPKLAPGIRSSGNDFDTSTLDKAKAKTCGTNQTYCMTETTIKGQWGSPYTTYVKYTTLKNKKNDFDIQMATQEGQEMSKSLEQNFKYYSNVRVKSFFADYTGVSRDNFNDTVRDIVYVNSDSGIDANGYKFTTLDDAMQIVMENEDCGGFTQWGWPAKGNSDQISVPNHWNDYENIAGEGAKVNGECTNEECRILSKSIIQKEGLDKRIVPDLEMTLPSASASESYRNLYAANHSMPGINPGDPRLKMLTTFQFFKKSSLRPHVLVDFNVAQTLGEPVLPNFKVSELYEESKSPYSEQGGYPYTTFVKIRHPPRRANISDPDCTDTAEAEKRLNIRLQEGLSKPVNIKAYCRQWAMGQPSVSEEEDVDLTDPDRSNKCNLVCKDWGVYRYKQVVDAEGNTVDVPMDGGFSLPLVKNEEGNYSTMDCFGLSEKDEFTIELERTKPNTMDGYRTINCMRPTELSKGDLQRCKEQGLKEGEREIGSTKYGSKYGTYVPALSWCVSRKVREQYGLDSGTGEQKYGNFVTKTKEPSSISS